MNTQPLMERLVPDPIDYIDFPDSTEQIPALDVAPYLRGDPGAKEAVAKRLGEITRTVGFFYLEGHGIEQDLIDRVFAESRRFHAQPLEKKQEIPLVDNVGYKHESLAPQRDVNTNIIDGAKPDLLSLLTIPRQRALDEPEVIAKEPFSAISVWPENLPGFRETVLDYQRRIEQLGRKFLPLWATSLGLPDDYFEPMFRRPQTTLQLLHYTPQQKIGDRQYGIAPHADNCLMTFLAQANVPGLAVRMPSGHWRAVEIRPGTLLVNTGNTMVRLTNGDYLSTKHRVINNTGVERFSIPVFFGPSDDAVVECVPTCMGPDRPAKYEPVSYLALRKWYYGYQY